LAKVKNLEKILTSILRIKSINSVFKLLLRPVAKRGFISEAFALHCPALGKIPVALPNGQVFFMENSGIDSVANCLYWLGIEGYEHPSTKIWGRLAEEAVTVLDIGAYTGLYALWAARVNRKAKIFAFEPLQGQYDYLVRNINLNGFDNVFPVQAVVCERDGVANINVRSGYLLPGSSSIIDKFRDGEVREQLSVDSITIDSFVREKAIRNVDLVKIDVEAAEPLILDGMHATVKAYHPSFIIEVLPTKATEDFLQQFFLSYGYSFYWLTGEGPVKVDQVKGDPTYGFSNYLFSKGMPPTAT